MITYEELFSHLSDLRKECINCGMADYCPYCFIHVEFCETVKELNAVVNGNCEV